MNKILFIFLLFTATLNAQVKITLKNTTGKRIDFLKIGNYYHVGTIEKDATKIITFPSITTDSGLPMLKVLATVDGETLETKWSPCATFWKTVTEGEYEMDIAVLTNHDGKNRLVLKKTYTEQ